jgi:hypothetical protein
MACFLQFLLAQGRAKFDGAAVDHLNCGGFFPHGTAPPGKRILAAK